MRLLTKEENRTVLTKLEKFLGGNLEAFLTMEPAHALVLIKNRVFIVRHDVLKMASSLPRKSVMTAGTCLGKITQKSKTFRLQVTALQYLAPYTAHRVWLKSQGEGSFLYGNPVPKRHVARITEGAPQKCGVLVMSPSDIPLGFGVLNKSSVELKESTNTELIAVFNQADVGLYIRKEREMFGLAAADDKDEYQPE